MMVRRLQKIDDIYSIGLLTEESDNNYIVLDRDKLMMIIIIIIIVEHTYNQMAGQRCTVCGHECNQTLYQ